MKTFLSKSLARTTGAVAAAGSVLLARAAWAQGINIPDVQGLRKVGFSTVIIDVIGWGLGIAGAVAVLYLIVGGFLYITAGGDEGKIDKAKNTIKNAIIGIVVILLALVIVFTINQALL